MPRYWAAQFIIGCLISVDSRSRFIMNQYTSDVWIWLYNEGWRGQYGLYAQ